MKYIMVTSFARHWDNIPNNSTRYTLGMFRGGMNESKLQENTRTTFIKINGDTKEFEKAWEGKVLGFRSGTCNSGECIWFNVVIEKEIDCPPELSGYTQGWYISEFDTDIYAKKETSTESDIEPKYFSRLLNTNDWMEFESLTYYLIRCLGILNSYRFPQKDQRGKADGFFKYGKLAVLYDCTLETNFEERKKEQLKNYCNQLKRGSIEFEKITITFSECSKTVWVITKNISSPRVLKQIDEIKIKEIPVQALINLYRNMITGNMNEISFEKQLENL